MALLFSGSKTKSAGIISSIIKERNLLNLKPAKRIIFKFDPFDEKCVNIRRFLWYFNTRKVLKTNPVCLVRTDIVCDRSEPTIDVSLASGELVQFKTSYLDELELLQLFNKHITSLAPKEEEKPAEVKTKSANAGKDKKRKK